jgi:Ribbon-helix-helix protein, copG family
MIQSMKRLQIHIEEELDDVLAVEAVRRKTSKAALIRQAVAERYVPAEDDLLAMSGLIEGQPDDSSSIDDVVYGRP